MLDLGRFAMGQVVPLVLVARAVGTPVATIHDADGAAVAERPLGPVGGDLVHSGSIRLGAGFASGTYRVVHRYRDAGNQPGLATAAFRVVEGGDAGGSVIALYAHDRPEGRYVLGQLSGGALVQGRNPHF